MTVAQLATEILSRCGEGYENWTDRALASFKSVAISYMSSPTFYSYECHGLVYNDIYTATGAVTSISIPGLIGVGRELVKFLDLKKVVKSVTTAVNLVSYAEKLASAYNSELAGTSQWYLSNEGTDTLIIFDEALAKDDMIEFAVIAWDNSLLADTANVISDYLTGGFLQACITGAVSLLQKELRA